MQTPTTPGTHRPAVETSGTGPTRAQPRTAYTRAASFTCPTQYTSEKHGATQSVDELANSSSICSPPRRSKSFPAYVRVIYFLTARSTVDKVCRLGSVRQTGHIPRTFSGLDLQGAALVQHLITANIGVLSCLWEVALLFFLVVCRCTYCCAAVAMVSAWLGRRVGGWCGMYVG